MVDVNALSQMDPRWKNNALGNSGSTIGNYGCLLTSMTMVANGFGFSETPATLNDKMKKAGGYQGAYIIPAALPAALPGMVFRDFMDCEKIPAPMAEIDASLGQGKPVIVKVDYSPNAGLQDHWIVLYQKRGNDYLLRDPWPFPAQSTEVTLLTSRYKFAGDPARIIQAVVYLDGNSPTPPPAKPKEPLDKGVHASFPVYAAADGLAMRSDTLVADTTLIKRVALGTKLTVLESDAAAQAKIGVLNQWLAVLDPADSTQGYTAAWYVSASLPGTSTSASSSGPAQPEATPTTVKPQNLLVKTTDEGVALRSRPQISDATLVKRVPVNTELLCTEGYDAALAKVGVVYQWLKVKDVTNCEYYVAAWYVKAVNGQAALGPKDQAPVSFAVPTGEPEPLVIRSAVEGLALRRLPLITGDTLLKRLPIDGELLVLEDPIIAARKLGKMGEWLHVRDLENTQGYVAAWYAIKRPDLAVDETKPVLG